MLLKMQTEIMTLEIAFILALLLLVIVLFVTERLGHDMIGLLVLVALGVTRTLDPTELFHGFSNEAIITIGAMFVLSAALTRTGSVAMLGVKLTEYSRGSPLRFLTYALTVACVMSAFINNTPVVLVFIPAVLTVCTKLGVSPSKFLMPISFASMLGGSCTLIGTSSNILVSSLSNTAGYGAIGMFEFSTIGIEVVIVGMPIYFCFRFGFFRKGSPLPPASPANPSKSMSPKLSCTTTPSSLEKCWLNPGYLRSEYR